MISNNVPHITSLRPGPLLHDSLRADSEPAGYNDFLLTILNYGSKVAGLSIFPSAWIPPYAALPAWLSEEWFTDPKGWNRSASEQGVSVFELAQLVSANQQYDIILRSSAVGESLDDRGRYSSFVVLKPFTQAILIAKIEEIFAELREGARHPRMGVCVQRYCPPELSGHVSNEVHLSATRNQWKYEIELPTYAPHRGLNSKFAKSPPEDRPILLAKTSAISSVLRQLCNWTNVRVDGRSHIEWCVSGSRLWVLQLDRESPTSSGENPHLMPQTHFADAPHPPENFRCFEPYRVQMDTPWKKLNNLRDFWVGKDPPRHKLYFASGDQIEEVLSTPEGENALATEIDHLTCQRAVLRTDCQNKTIRSFNLPRTHTVSGPEAIEWLRATLGEMEKRGATAGEVAFILHRYIPARAAAWSYYSPGDDLVRVDCLWGLPDGLQFLTHDTYELDARTGAEVSAEVRFKRDFLQEQADGSWEYVPVARQFGRDRVLSSEALRHIALQTVAVSGRLGERAQIMWFCDLPSELGMGSQLPWYRSRDFQTHNRIERPPYRPREIRTLDDLERVSEDLGNYILAVQPTADLVRADEKFLDKVVQVAKAKNIPVELSGSVLGHAYYRLIDEGIMVLAPEPKYQRARGKRAHHKLVRDAIPANIAARGERVSFGRLAPQEAVTALVGKLFEEGLEVSGAGTPDSRLEELADVFEVLRGLTNVAGFEMAQVVDIANSKREKRGGFDQQTVLIETEKAKSPTDKRPLAGESEAPLSLHRIGVVTIGDQDIRVPFTRLIGDKALSANLPLDGGTVAVQIGIDAGNVIVRISPTLLRDNPSSGQGLLFDESDAES